MNTSKNNTRRRKDWHPADIKAALAKAGYSFAKIAREYGYGDNSPNAVLQRSWPVIEKIVGDIIGRHPSDIWPSRYDARRAPLRAIPSSFKRLRTRLSKTTPVAQD